MFNKIVESCRFLLENYSEAQPVKDYLNSRLNSASQEVFQFGYFPNMNNINVLTSLIGNDLLLDAKLFYSWDIEDSFSRREGYRLYFDNYPLIIPFKNPYGETVALIGRTLLPDNEYKAKKIPKYKNTSEEHNPAFIKGNNLFGLYENKQEILKQNSVFIVEGQFDVIKAYECGFRNVVALSNSNMTSYQFSVISRYTDNIFLLLDNDEAGIKGRKCIIEKFGKLANIRNFYLPDEYKDIDEYLTNNNFESLSFIIKD